MALETVMRVSNGNIVGGSASSGGGHEIVNDAGTSMTQRDALQFSGGLSVSDDSTNERTVVTGDYEVIDWDTWKTYTEEQQGQHPNAIITNAPDFSGDGVQTFAIATTAWVANTGTDASEFPYVADITSSSFTSNFIPSEVLLLGADASAYPTSAEQTDIDLVDKYLQFSTSGIRLRATAQPANALTLIVRGAVYNASNQNDVRQFTLSSSSWASNTGSDASEFPYVYTIANAGYSDGFIANEILLLGADISDYMSTAELTAKNLIDGQILINSTEIRLRATAQPQSNLTLVIRG